MARQKSSTAIASADTGVNATTKNVKKTQVKKETKAAAAKTSSPAKELVVKDLKKTTRKPKAEVEKVEKTKKVKEEVREQLKDLEYFTNDSDVLYIRPKPALSLVSDHHMNKGVTNELQGIVPLLKNHTKAVEVSELLKKNPKAVDDDNKPLVVNKSHLLSDSDFNILTEKCKDLRKQKMHFGGCTGVTVAVLLEEITRELLSFGVTNLYKSGKKNMCPKFMVMSGVEELPMYPLFCKSKTFLEAYNLL